VNKWCVREMLTKKEIIRTFVEMGIFTILFSWVPIIYQIILSLIFSALVEIILRRRQKTKLHSELSAEAMAKMVQNIKTVR